jgi:hypothetical protein
MNGSGKHSSLLRYGKHYCREYFYCTGPCRCFFNKNKLFNQYRDRKLDTVVKIVSKNEFCERRGAQHFQQNCFQALEKTLNHHSPLYFFTAALSFMQVNISSTFLVTNLPFRVIS